MTTFIFEIDIKPKSVLGEMPIEIGEDSAKFLLGRRIAMGSLNEYEHITIVTVKEKGK